ncbi:MAG: LytTR family DNA-binding domain-containing protein [Oscillospiraceae bacterium]|nr:LytTR family DNA-binding domain-containing protein [Oscillospiraceae bacterium]
MYKVAICEDEQVFSNAQEKACRSVLEKLNIEHQIELYASGEEFLSAGQKERYDLILLDIIMGGMSGMELAKVIRESDREAVIIFITSSREYVFEGYDVNALHYLIKPVDVNILERLIRESYTEKFQDSFFVFKTGGLNQRTAVKDIVSLETVGRKVEVTLKDGTLQYSGKLTELLEKLPKGRFVRCHQAFAVNIENIRELTRFEAITHNGKKIPISRTFQSDIKKAFLRQMGGR